MRQHFQINIYMVLIVNYHFVEYLGVVFVLVLDTVNQLVNSVLYIFHQFLLLCNYNLLLFYAFHHRFQAVDFSIVFCPKSRKFITVNITACIKVNQISTFFLCCFNFIFQSICICTCHIH